MTELEGSEVYGGPHLVPLYQPGDEKLLLPLPEMARMLTRPGLTVQTCQNAIHGYLRAGWIKPEKVRVGDAPNARRRYFFRGETALIAATLQAVSADAAVADPTLLAWVAAVMSDWDDETVKGYGAENLARNPASHVISIASAVPCDWRLVITCYRHREHGRVERRPALVERVSRFQTVILMEAEYHPTATIEIPLNPLLASVYAERPVAN